jgi:hypothetical protein
MCEELIVPKTPSQGDHRPRFSEDHGRKTEGEIQEREPFTFRDSVFDDPRFTETDTQLIFFI